jgi:hypothetical protein
MWYTVNKIHIPIRPRHNRSIQKRLNGHSGTDELALDTWVAN